MSLDKTNLDDELFLNSSSDPVRKYPIEANGRVDISTDTKGNSLEMMFTLLDYLSFPQLDKKRISNEDIFHLVEKIIGNTIDFPKNGFILKENKQKYIEKYRNIGSALSQSKEFWKQVFGQGIKMPEIVEKEVDEIISKIALIDRQVGDTAYQNKIKELILSFIRKSYAFSSQKVYGPYRCAFLKIVMSFLHCYRELPDNLSDRTKQFESELFPEHPVEHETDTNPWCERKLRTSSGDIIPISQTSRTKDLFRTVLKLLKLPSFELDESIKDLIGVRIEVTYETMMSVLKEMLERLKKNKNAHTFHIDTKGFRLKGSKIEDGDNRRELPMTQNESLNLGVGNIGISEKPYKYFSCIHIYGKLKQDQNGDHINNSNKDPSFEIQIVPVGNTNETGLSHHAIYEKVTAIPALARLFGVVRNEWLTTLAEDAYRLSTDENFEKSRIKSEGIKSRPAINQAMVSYRNKKTQSILNRFLEEVVLIPTENRVIIPKQLIRLSKIGMLPKSYQSLAEELHQKMFDVFVKEVYPNKEIDKLKSGKDLSTGAMDKAKQTGSFIEDVPVNGWIAKRDDGDTWHIDIQKKDNQS